MKLSLVSRGRNDNYGNFYIERTKFCLNKYISIFKELNLTPNDVEIVFVDWGSDIPIYTLLDDGFGFVKHIIVPPEITKNFDPPETKFSFVHSINAGIIRCSGDHIIHVDLDVYTDVESMKRLMLYIETPGAQLFQHYFTRFKIDPEFYKNFFVNPNSDQEKNVCKLIEPNLSMPSMFNGSSTAVMASKKAWNTVGGYNELFIYWGAQDVELFTRFYAAGYLGKDLYKTNQIRFVHMEHNHQFYQPKNNNSHLHCRSLENGITPNGPNWGIQNIQFQEIIK